jgi:hypothetical protein
MRQEESMWERYCFKTFANSLIFTLIIVVTGAVYSAFSQGNGTVSTTKPILVTFFLLAENFFVLAREDCLEAALFRAIFLFAVVRLEGSFLRAFLFGVVFLADFFRIVVFFFGMRAV